MTLCRFRFVDGGLFVFGNPLYDLPGNFPLTNAFKKKSSP